MGTKLRESSYKSKRLYTKPGKKYLHPLWPEFFKHLSITRDSLYYLDNFRVGIANMLFAVYYIIAFIVLILHFTGYLERWGMQWLVLVLAVTVFPAVLYL
jgi:hypothetical protein